MYPPPSHARFRVYGESTDVGGVLSQTVQRQTNQMPAWLMSSRAVVRVVGAIVKKHAENTGELIGLLRRERPPRRLAESDR